MVAFAIIAAIVACATTTSMIGMDIQGNVIPITNAVFIPAPLVGRFLFVVLVLCIILLQ